MVSDRMKQRLIGVAVLIALAVIFIPMLFDLQPSRPLNQNSLIPPAPEISPVEIGEPDVADVDNEVPDHDSVFVPQETTGMAGESPPPAETAITSAEEPLEDRRGTGTSAEETTAPPAVESGLGDSGLPGAWVIQVASFSEAATARQQVARLQEADFKAYHEQGAVAGKTVYRVFVGPFVARGNAEEEKKQIDRSLGVDSLILAFEP